MRKLAALASTALILCAATQLPVLADPGEQAPWNAAHGLVSAKRTLFDPNDGDRPEELRQYDESTYDNKGNRTRFVEHRWINDRWRVETTTSTYDHASNLVHEVKDRGSQVVERWFDYDGRGTLVEERIETYNRSELTYVELKTYRYDPQGNLEEEIHDLSGANEVLQRWTFTYDERGDLLEETAERDNGKDGLDGWSRSTYAYNERRDLVEEVQESGFGYGGATSIVLLRLFYDTNGDLQERRWQLFDADSRLVREDLREYTHEPSGSQVIERIVFTDFPAAGPPAVTFERSLTWRYDPRGNVVEVLSEEDLQDGRCYRSAWTRRLDPQGRPLEEIITSTSLDCDDEEVLGTSGTTRTFSYDGWGNLIQQASAYERDGIPRSIWTTTYEY